MTIMLEYLPVISGKCLFAKLNLTAYSISCYRTVALAPVVTYVTNDCFEEFSLNFSILSIAILLNFCTSEFYWLNLYRQQSIECKQIGSGMRSKHLRATYC